jgi:hypothetical protein
MSSLDHAFAESWLADHISKERIVHSSKVSKLIKIVLLIAGENFNCGRNDLKIYLQDNLGDIMPINKVSTFVNDFLDAIMNNSTANGGESVGKVKGSEINFSDSDGEEDDIQITGGGEFDEDEDEDEDYNRSRPSKRPRTTQDNVPATKGWGGLTKKKTTTNNVNVSSSNGNGSSSGWSVPHHDLEQQQQRTQLNPHAQNFRPSTNPSPPNGYICKICNIPGHFIAHCPNRNNNNNSGSGSGSGSGEKHQGEVTKADPNQPFCFIDGNIFGHRNDYHSNTWPLELGDIVEYIKVPNGDHPKNKFKTNSFILLKKGPGYSSINKKKRKKYEDEPPPIANTSDTVIVRRIPKSYFNIGRINAFFEMFGEVSNILMKRGIGGNHSDNNVCYIQYLNSK